MKTLSPILARERSLYEAFSNRALEAHRRELAQLQEQLGTGRRVNRASDAPSDFARARQMEVLQHRYTQHQRAIDAARLWVDHTQQALDDLAELFTQAQVHGVRLANGTFSQADREAEARHLESLMASVLDRLNARSGREYLFAGSRTNVEPFEQSGAGVTYAGNDGDRIRAVGPGLDLKINISGARLQDTGQGFTLTEALQHLIDAARAGDTAALGTALEGVTTARDHLIDLNAEAGSTGHRLTLTENQLRESVLLAERRRSEAEDADLAEVITSLQREQTSLQAALQVTASVQQLSLLDFLR